MQETYRSAPIIEAVLDIKARLPNAPVPDLERLQVGEEENYPGIRHPFRVNFKIQRDVAEKDPVTEAEHFRNGFAFSSKDLLQVFQARPDGFSHNRLAPYIDWSTFRTEAKRLWEKYRALAMPVAIEMLGLNYINRITLPAGAEISDYFRTYIQTPNELPRILEAHNLLVQMSDPKSGATIAISMNLGPTDQPDKVAALLNIQVFKIINAPTIELPEELIWSTFEQLRELKNLAFESSITERARETFR